MKILEDIRFEKSLPRENQAQILGKIREFINAWYENINPTELNRRFSVKKVQGTTKIEQVWKFKVNDGDRVLYTKGEYVGLRGTEYEHALILLMFCNHDEQILKARQLSTVLPKGLDEEELVEQVIDLEAKEILYNPETAITRVFKHIGIEALVDLESLQGIYYLNENQRECVNADYRPLILFGSAGSGKTTIGVYKLIDLIKQNPHIKVGYFTYSNKLAKVAKQIYTTVLKNELEEEDQVRYKECVDFHPLRDWLLDKKTPYVLQYDQFNEEFFIPLRQNLAMNPEYKEVILKLTAYEVWREIRGLIKGYAGDEWKPRLQDGTLDLLTEEEYMNVSGRYALYNKAQRKVLYALALKYVAWQKQKGIYDENDLCRKHLSALKDGKEVREKYDWIVIDEVQDLTELEIYLLQKYVKEEGNFLLSGDYHQTIAPTYFDTKRIMTLLEHHQYRYKEDANRFTLTYNYRNPKRIVELANTLSDLREKLFGKDKRNDYSKEVAMCKEKGKLYTLCGNSIEQKKLLKEAIKKAYVYIVVATEKEKQMLKEELGNDLRIFTIYEVKGLENKYIIGVNLISSFKKQWEEMMHLSDIQEGKENYLYRYLMNMFYVALTRTQENFCFLEKEVDASFLEKIVGQHLQHEVHFDIQTFDLEEDSEAEDFYREAQKYEVAEDYTRALAQYQKLSMPKAKLRADFCQGKLYELRGEFQKAGYHYEQAKELECATKVYEKIKDYKSYYRCFLKWDEKRFLSEVLLNSSFDYTKDLMPYMTEELAEKIQEIYIDYYSERLKQSIQDKEDALVYTELINEQLEEMTEGLE